MCNQCYAAHRALGAHVTRGKCIGLDTFSNQEVQFLIHAGGNRYINSKYEANLPSSSSGVKPPPTPCNGCSSTTCHDCKQRLEYIKKKYEKKLWYSDTPVTSTPTQMQQQQQQQQQSATTSNNNENDDPFGLFVSNRTIKPAASSSFTTTSKQPNPSDTDFFASFGL